VFLASIATGDETWATCFTLRTKKSCNIVETFKLSDSQKLGIVLVCWKVCGMCILRCNEFTRVQSVFREQQSTRTATATNARGCSQEMPSLSMTVQPQHSARRTAVSLKTSVLSTPVGLPFVWVAETTLGTLPISQ